MTAPTTAWLRVQTPTERCQRRLDDLTADQLGDYAAAWRAQLGFPDDWPEHPDQWDCAIGYEPVHEDYWRTLVDTQAELRLARGKAAAAAQQLALAQARAEEQAATILRQAQRIADLDAGQSVVEELKTLVQQLRTGGS